MYGGSGKLGRGGSAAGGRGGGGGKRLHNFPPPPPHRPSGGNAGRLSVGGAGPRNRNTNSAAAATSAPPATEETFSLVTGNPLAFAMIIRLTPDLVDEIKRVEAQGGTARIKFDPNANNSSGNIIDVGGKDFSFTWSPELGDLCDIYEERQNGEEGNGLLVESGCPWRKLNVQRILDESTKNHVKMRSEEAERKLKSRKAIILDHGNPATKNQLKAFAAAEANPWRTGFQQKKEPAFKKRKTESPVIAVGGPSKSVYKPGLASTTTSKGTHSASPLRSTPDRSRASASPFGTGNLPKCQVNVEEIIPIRSTSKENVASSARETAGSKESLKTKPTDLQSMLISLLMENPKGMSLKALEKAIGDASPNSVKKIEPIVKKIATYQAPGKYLLKPGVELDGLKKPSSESESSPEDHHNQTPAPVDNPDPPAPDPIFVEKISIDDLKEQTQLNSKLEEELNSVEKIDIQQISPDLFGEKKIPDNSSSDSSSSSDSDSDSSDSGSDSGSHSRSRSKSPAGSGSSSESESNRSSNSKQGSDEDVDIMTSDDDKEIKSKLQVNEPGQQTSPNAWKNPDEKFDDMSDPIDIEKDLFGDDPEIGTDAIADSLPNIEDEKTVEDMKCYSIDPCLDQENQLYTGDLFGERDNMLANDVVHDHSDSSERTSGGKGKRGSDLKLFDEKPEKAKRFKGTSQLPVSASPPNRLIKEPTKDPVTQMRNRIYREGATDFGIQKGDNHAIPGKSTPNYQQSEQKMADIVTRTVDLETTILPGKKAESMGRRETAPLQKDKFSREIQEEDGYANEKMLPKNFKDGGGGEKCSIPPDSLYRKYGERTGKFKETGQAFNSQSGPISSPKNNNRIDVNRSPIVNGRLSVLQRELSDLEMGELREPEPVLLETTAVKQIERKTSFKKSENKPSSSDYWNQDFSKVRTSGKATLDLEKPSPPGLRSGFSSNPEATSNKKTPLLHSEDLTRTHNRAMQSQAQRLSGEDQAEVGKPRHNDVGASQGVSLDGYGNTPIKAPVSGMQQHDNSRGIKPNSMKESKTQKSNTLGDLSNKQKDSFFRESNNGGRKRRESSSDENSLSYSKYEKEEPDFKGPIKDFSQYKEYVHEYREKYDSYCSLNKLLESDRSEFHKYGRDLDFARDRDTDRYYNILGQLKEAYRQCLPRHHRLKKIFVILHDELKHLKQRIKDYAVPYTRD